mgnify:CR=1 FL=1|jgi:D-glucosaminate-specific PTS system IIB component
MATIGLARVDFRLIHGQVITKWSRKADAKKIVIIDDLLFKDAFMSDIYVMAAPPGIPVKIYDVQTAVKEWKENQFGPDRILLLFKNIDTAKRVVQGGIALEELQIGGLGGGPGKVQVYKGIAVDKNDIEDLKQISEHGTRVYFQMIPEDPTLSLEKALQNYNK